MCSDDAGCKFGILYCGPCRPKWMKMVDNLYSGSHDDNNRNKLVHYCLIQPDKLDRIAKYLHDRLAQDVHRRYKRLRLAGIHGIDGVIRKTVVDRLNLDVLHQLNMDKIIPSLLFNICDRTELPQTPDHPHENPSQEAVDVFRKLVSRASLSNIKPVITSILTYLDDNKLWRSSDFPLLIFQYFDLIKNPQISHSVVKLLVDHLNTLNEKEFSVVERTTLVQVICCTVTNLAKGAVGPDVFRNFETLLQILRDNINKNPRSGNASIRGSRRNPNSERQFQEAVIVTIAEFAKNLPDIQKIEILKFILNFGPMAGYATKQPGKPKTLIMVLLQTMLSVAQQYKTVALSSALNLDFLNTLLKGVAVDPDPSIRLIVQKILQTLTDRHNNRERLLTVRTYIDPPLSDFCVWEKPSRQDILFMKKIGPLFTENFYHQLLDATNKVDNLEHLSCTIGIIALEMGADQVVVELFRLVLTVQTKLADDSTCLSVIHKCALHSLLASAMSILVQVADLPSLQTHVGEVIQLREEKAPYLLPLSAFNRTNTEESYPQSDNIDSNLLFAFDQCVASLTDAGYSIDLLSRPYPQTYSTLYPTVESANPAGFVNANRDSFQEGTGYTAEYIGNGGSPMGNHSLTSTLNRSRSNSISSFTDSLYSAGESDKHLPYDESLTFNEMKKITSGSSDSTVAKSSKLAAVNQNQQTLADFYNNADFDEICTYQSNKTLNSRDRAQILLDDISTALVESKSGPTSPTSPVGPEGASSPTNLLSHAGRRLKQLHRAATSSADKSAESLLSP